MISKTLYVVIKLSENVLKSRHKAEKFLQSVILFCVYLIGLTVATLYELNFHGPHKNFLVSAGISSRRPSLERCTPCSNS